MSSNDFIATLNGVDYALSDFVNTGWFAKLPEALQNMVAHAAGIMQGRCTDPVTPALGSVSVTVTKDRPYTPGLPLRLVATEDTGVTCSGVVTDYDKAGGALTLDIQAVTGTGTHDSWTVEPDLGASHSRLLTALMGFDSRFAVADAAPATPTEGMIWFDPNAALMRVRRAGQWVAIDVPSAATEAAPGMVELATDAEAIAGTDTARAVTPAGLAAARGVDAGVVATNRAADSAAVASQFAALNPDGGAVTVTASTVLTAASARYVRCQPTTAGIRITLPDATTVKAGRQSFVIANDQTDGRIDVLIHNSAGVLLAVVPGGGVVQAHLCGNTSATGDWQITGDAADCGAGPNVPWPADTAAGTVVALSDDRLAWVYARPSDGLLCCRIIRRGSSGDWQIGTAAVVPASGGGVLTQGAARVQGGAVPADQRVLAYGFASGNVRAVLFDCATDIPTFGAIAQQGWSSGYPITSSSWPPFWGDGTCFFRYYSSTDYIGAMLCGTAGLVVQITNDVSVNPSGYGSAYINFNAAYADRLWTSLYYNNSGSSVWAYVGYAAISGTTLSYSYANPFNNTGSINYFSTTDAFEGNSGQPCGWRKVNPTQRGLVFSIYGATIGHRIAYVSTSGGNSYQPSDITTNTSGYTYLPRIIDTIGDDLAFIYPATGGDNWSLATLRCVSNAGFSQFQSFNSGLGCTSYTIRAARWDGAVISAAFQYSTNGLSLRRWTAAPNGAISAVSNAVITLLDGNARYAVRAMAANGGFVLHHTDISTLEDVIEHLAWDGTRWVSRRVGRWAGRRFLYSGGSNNVYLISSGGGITYYTTPLLSADGMAEFLWFNAVQHGIELVRVRPAEAGAAGPRRLRPRRFDLVNPSTLNASPHLRTGGLWLYRPGSPSNGDLFNQTLSNAFQMLEFVP